MEISKGQTKDRRDRGKEKRGQTRDGESKARTLLRAAPKHSLK